MKLKFNLLENPVGVFVDIEGTDKNAQLLPLLTDQSGPNQKFPEMVIVM